ncbi:MAG: hypothetical protein K2K21_15015 [Lachnospiraceae bacterium]|nr:hypothetical protein [Lachnospiraceae bacterium]
MRKNELKENGMRKRQVGNYLKAYPHIYEAFRKDLLFKNVGVAGAIALDVMCIFIVLFIAVVTALYGDGDYFMFCCIVDAIVLIIPGICTFVSLEESKRSGMISLTELELMEKDLAWEKEKVGNWGYSTKESIIIGFYRIPRKGQKAVYRGKSFCRIGRYRGQEYELEFFYEDGTHLSVWLRKDSEASDEKNFVQLIRKYDDSIKIYRYQKMCSYMGANGMHYPFERLKAEVPFVRKELIDELNTLCNGNSFWKLEAKSENEHNDNKEVELTLRGTALTWLIYIAGICLWICIFLLFYFTPIIRRIWHNYLVAGGLVYLLVPFLVLCGAELCWYLCFFKKARKITDNATAILYKGTF